MKSLKRLCYAAADVKGIYSMIAWFACPRINEKRRAGKRFLRFPFRQSECRLLEVCQIFPVRFDHFRDHGVDLVQRQLRAG